MKEIIKGVIAEMREFIENPTIGTETEREVKLEKYLKGCMKDYADRIEVVVAKKETTTPTCKDSLQVGDMAKMREALEAARDLLLPQCNGGTTFAKACGETVNKIMDAISAPARKDVVQKDCSTDCVLYNKCSGRVKCAECGKELCDTDRDEHGYCSICAEEYAAARVAERNGAK